MTIVAVIHTDSRHPAAHRLPPMRVALLLCGPTLACHLGDAPLRHTAKVSIRLAGIPYRTGRRAHLRTRPSRMIQISIEQQLAMTSRMP